MSIFKRIFGIGSAEMNAALDKMEDPIKMSEQGIRDLKVDLRKSLEGLAQVKAITIRTRKELEMHRQQSRDYEQKAVLLLQRAQKGQIDANEADRLAAECLAKKEQAESAAQQHQQMLQNNEVSANKMEQNVQKLKSQISTWENEMKTLKARAKVSEASQKLNRALANVDSSSTLGMLERMRDRVNQQEALAESYGEISDANTSVDDEITKALGSGSSSSNSASLLELKARLGLQQGNSAGANAESSTGESTAAGTAGEAPESVKPE